MSDINASGPVSLMPMIVQPHQPPPDDREPKTRQKLLFFDRIKILTILAVIFGFAVAKQHSDIPIMSWGDALDRQVRAKSWMFILAALEIVRQLHMWLSERSESYHRAWHRRVWSRWDAFVARRNPWLRFRVARACKIAFIFVVALLICSRMIWHISFWDGLLEAPSRISDFLFGQASGLPFIIQILFYVGLAIIQFVAIFWFMSRGGVDTYMPSEIKTRFSDVWGQDHVLERVKENILFLEKPEELESKGGHVPGGILLWGPPGTGKTLMAEAVAGETGRPYVFVDPGAFQNMFFGVGILKVKSLFRRLRKLALRFGGVIVFFDEADVLGNRGGQVAQQMSLTSNPLGECCHGLSYLSEQSQFHVFESQMSAHRAPERRSRFMNKIVMPGMGGGSMGELQALLTELSGLKKPRGFFNRRVRAFLNMPPKQPPKYRILTMMATNMPSSLDPALLRPGRLDRIYKVGYPSKDGRKRTYEGYFNKIKHAVTPEQTDKLATMTPYATGASIKDLVNEALIVAMRNGRDFVIWPDVVEARKLKMVGPGENVDYVERERHWIAVHEACHALMAYRVRKGHEIDLATIEKGGDFLGFVNRIPIDEQFLKWRSTFESDILVALASLAGERLFFDGDNSSGVGGDLQTATMLSMRMESLWGMGASISSHAADEDPNEIRVSGEMLRGPKGEQIEKRLQDLLQQAMRILEENRFEVLAIAHALETHKTITGEDIAAIVGGYPGPLVDGRPYHQPQFIEMAERYHTRVLEAHRQQGKVDMALPTWVQTAAPVAAAEPAPWGAVAGANGGPPNGRAPTSALPPPAPPPPPPPQR